MARFLSWLAPGPSEAYGKKRVAEAASIALKIISERTEVQNPLLRYAAQIGWTFVAQDDALTRRGGETSLEELFRAMLAELMTGRVRVTSLIDARSI